MEKLIQEIIKYYKNKPIKFVGGNNRNGTLVYIPSFRKMERYYFELSKADSLLDNIVDIMSQNGNDKRDKSAECLLRVLYSKYEVSFVAVAIDKRICETNHVKEMKMDEVSTEAMIQEANITTKSARIISQHIRQFLGRSLMASEKERRDYFKDADLKPTVKRKILDDETIIPYWYKRPDDFIKRQIKSMIEKELLNNVSQVDIAIGEDHGGGKFRVTLKVNFRLSNMKTHSYIAQLARCTKMDNTRTQYLPTNN